eukprot:12490-Heterococcus_DN1.PRE.1
MISASYLLGEPLSACSFLALQTWTLKAHGGYTVSAHDPKAGDNHNCLRTKAHLCCCEAVTTVLIKPAVVADEAALNRAVQLGYHTRVQQARHASALVRMSCSCCSCQV